jgi:hypothetical protein
MSGASKYINQIEEATRNREVNFKEERGMRSIDLW